MLVHDSFGQQEKPAPVDNRLAHAVNSPSLHRTAELTIDNAHDSAHPSFPTLSAYPETPGCRLSQLRHVACALPNRIVSAAQSLRT